MQLCKSRAKIDAGQRFSAKLQVGNDVESLAEVTLRAFPAACDLAGTTFIHAAYAAIPASVVPAATLGLASRGASACDIIQ